MEAAVKRRSGGTSPASAEFERSRTQAQQPLCGGAPAAVKDDGRWGLWDTYVYYLSFPQDAGSTLDAV